MVDEGKVCADAKINSLEEYFTIPKSLQREVDVLTQEIATLGEDCNSATEFEEKFVLIGLSERYNSIFPRCSPKMRKMTREEKQKSRETAKEILRENKGALIEDAMTDTAGRALAQVRDEIWKKSREHMIEDGTYADYTIRKNNIQTVGALARFLDGKFKHKGEEQL